MVRKKCAVRLTEPEIHHVLFLLRSNESHDDRSYYGNATQYWHRSERIIRTLNEALGLGRVYTDSELNPDCGEGGE
jgi:hypothetical protein